MGKKKDKETKSKKKPDTDTTVETPTGRIEYAEQVSAQDVMELVNSLSLDLAQLDRSHQMLQQQLAQMQRPPLWLYTVLMGIILILGIGVTAVAYYSARINARIDDNMGMVSTRIGNMKVKINGINTAMNLMSSDLNQLNASLENVSADLTTINQSVNMATSELSRMNAEFSNITTDTRRAVRPVDPRYPWR